MADPSADNNSPPLPSKGSYSFNFDDFDETSNPFQSKTKIGSSPIGTEITEDPFKPRTRLGHSPPPSGNTNDTHDEADPFNSRKGLNRSPPIVPDNNNDLKQGDDRMLDVERANNDANMSAGSFEEEWCDADEGEVDKAANIRNKEERTAEGGSADPVQKVQEDASTKGTEATVAAGQPGELEVQIPPASNSSSTLYEDARDDVATAVPQNEDASCNDGKDAGQKAETEKIHSEQQDDIKKAEQHDDIPKAEVPDQKTLMQKVEQEQREEEADMADSEGVEERAVKKKKTKRKEKPKKSGGQKELTAAEMDLAGSGGQNSEGKEKGNGKKTEVMEEVLAEATEKLKAQAEENPVAALKPKAEGDPGHAEAEGENEGKREKSKKEKKAEKLQGADRVEDVKPPSATVPVTEKENRQNEVKEKDESVSPSPEDSSTNVESTPKKKTGAKKTLKKPKSKLQPPQSVSRMPQAEEQAPQTVPAEDPEPSLPIASDPPAIQDPAVEAVKSQNVKEANQMAQSLEMVHDFGAGEDAEMPESDNEGFVPASDVFSDAATWEMLDKFGEDSAEKESNAGRESRFVKSDTHVKGAANPKEQDKTRAAGSEGAEVFVSASEDDLMSQNTPSPAKSGGSRQIKKHPAARVLDDKIDGAAAGETGQVNDVDHILQCNPGKGDGGPVDMSSSMGDASKESVVQLVQVLKYSQTDWNKMKQELELNFQAQLLQKEREWSKKLADREKKMAAIDENARSVKQTNEDMRAVVTEFEKTIAQLQAEKEKTCSASNQSLQDIVREKDQVLEDLHSVETAFSNLHQRYEKTKSVVEGFKQNEEVLKKCVADYQAKLKKSEQKLQQLKQQAEEKLDQAHGEIDKERRGHSSEMARLQAALKKAELQISGLDQNLEQKIKENQELTAICDELIAKVGVQ